MNLLELQNVLGERINITKSNMGPNKAREENEKSDMISRLAKQMINNADVILRADKMTNDMSRIKDVVGKK